MARFDEENNIQWARRLEGSRLPCHLRAGRTEDPRQDVPGGPREDGGIRRYVHMSTGNYNDSTARIYTGHRPVYR